MESCRYGQGALTQKTSFSTIRIGSTTKTTRTLSPQTRSLTIRDWDGSITISRRRTSSARTRRARPTSSMDTLTSSRFETPSLERWRNSSERSGTHCSFSTTARMIRIVPIQATRLDFISSAPFLTPRERSPAVPSGACAELSRRRSEAIERRYDDEVVFAEQNAFK